MKEVELFDCLSRIFKIATFNAMNQLAHLPANKQRDIAEILDIIKGEADPIKIVLFGSHATGDWVEDEYVEDGINYTYISDYDFLVVIRKGLGRDKENAIISQIEERCAHIRGVVSPIMHSIEYINEGLRFGQYFFTDIIKEGIILFDTEECHFIKPQRLSVEQEKEKARNYFDIWFPQGEGFLETAEFSLQKDNLRVGAFLAHQAVECFFNTIFLVFTGYKPKTHNLYKLRVYSKRLSKDLYRLFRAQLNNKEESRLFDLLKRGYIDARYKMDYEITQDELADIIVRVKMLRDVVKQVCEEKI